MSATAHRITTTTLTVCALTVSALTGSALLPGLSSSAHAAAHHPARDAALVLVNGKWKAVYAKRARRKPSTPVRLKALHVAASERGAPYRWGAEGPHAFDCSGLVQYAYRKAGAHLPRTAQQQYDHTRHESHPRLGDLVFFHHGSSVYHVGIYAGHDRIWHAPHTGATVQRTRIWTRQVLFGQVH